VLKLCEEGLELIEVAPGIDMQRDVLDQMDFQPIVRNVKLMDAGIFSQTWGGLAALRGAAA
jgi:propionate CoA-transferase